MSHRSHLFSLRIFHAIRESCIAPDKYSYHKFSCDILSGITVGIIAIPLSMALAIASGVAPQYGLYTAFIAGFVIALTGGSRFSVSGPTAAFVVILQPIAASYGLGGLLIAGMMSGIILLLMAWARLGRFIEYIPESVTLGFTGGIAIVIATLQLKDFLGLQLPTLPEHYYQKVWLLIQHVGESDPASFMVAVCTLVVLLGWRKLNTAIPPHLPAVVIASVLALVLNNYGYSVATIGSSFSYVTPDGLIGQGIPPYLPHLDWPWHYPNAQGQPIVLSIDLFQQLIPAAFAIAMLGAIESLLCAVVLDGMTGKRHSANSELLGQGIGNLLVPFFGGITATAAIARSAANFKAGAQSPISAMIHALVVLIGLVLLAKLLAYLPMPAMAALLMLVAWNMSEAPKAVHLVKTAPKADIVVFLLCLFLTVWFDMVIAITTGILLASMLFMKEIASMTKIVDISANKKQVEIELPTNWRVFKVQGPLFFAAAESIFAQLTNELESLDGIVLYLDGVPILDAGGLAAMNKLMTYSQQHQKCVYFAEWQFQPLKTLARAKIQPIAGVSYYFSTLAQALAELPKN